MTVTECVAAYRRHHLRGRASEKKVRQIQRDYIDPHLGSTTLGELKAPLVVRLLDKLGGQLGAQSLNHVRGILHAAIEYARRRRSFEGPNVVDLVGTRKVTTSERDVLRLYEVEPFLRRFPRSTAPIVPPPFSLVCAEVKSTPWTRATWIFQRTHCTFGDQKTGTPVGSPLRLSCGRTSRQRLQKPQAKCCFRGPTGTVGPGTSTPPRS